MDPGVRRNVILNTLAESLWGFQANMVIAATVLTVLLRSYGAGPRMIGALAAIETAGFLLPQILGAYVFSSRKRRKIHLVLWHVVGICSFMFWMGFTALFADRLAPATCRLLLLAGFVGFTFGVGVVMAAWADWQADVFDISIRGTVGGLALFGAAFAGTAGALLAGRIIAWMESPGSFALLYLGGGVISVIAILGFAGMHDPFEDEPEVSERPRLGDLFRRFQHSLLDQNFRAYLIGRVLAACGFSVLPFIAVHFAAPGMGGLSGSTIVTCGAAMTVGTAVGNLLLGRIGDSKGHRLGVLIGMTVQILTLLSLVVLPGKTGCVLAYLGAGVASGGTWVSHSNLVLETCPHEDRVAHISAGNLVVGLSTFALPLLAGAIVARWDTPVLFLGSLGFSVVALGWFVLSVHDPRRRADVAPV